MWAKEGQPFDEDPERVGGEDWEARHVVSTDDRLWELARVVLGDLPREHVARELGVSDRTVKEWVIGRSKPTDAIVAIHYAVKVARERLEGSLDDSATPRRILSAYREWRATAVGRHGIRVRRIEVPNEYGSWCELHRR